MSQDANRVGKNIKKLRQAYGESQQNLADAIHVSPSAIANYEKGDRVVDIQKLQAIALRYRYPVEQLIRISMSPRKQKSNFIVSKKITEMFKTIFPLFCSEKALEDSSFKRAYKYNIKIWEAIDRGVEPEHEDIERCLDSYYISLEESQKTESIANLLSMFFFIAVCATADENDIRINEALRNSFITGDAIETKFFTRVRKHDNDAERKKISCEFNEIIIPLIVRLKASPEWIDLAHYYVALRYYFGMVDNNISDDWNSTIGQEMMRSLQDINNKYACNLIKFIESL